MLTEIARHMKRAWRARDKPGSVGFKAGHQLAHKGWKFGSGVIDLADGSALAGIKGLRALIIAGRHEWFETAARQAPGQMVNASSAPSDVERQYLANLAGETTPLARFDVGEAQIWMMPEPGGWRVPAVFVRDAQASGLKEVMQLAAATGGGGCLAIAALGILLSISILSVGRRRR